MFTNYTITFEVAHWILIGQIDELSRLGIGTSSKYVQAVDHSRI